MGMSWFYLCNILGERILPIMAIRISEADHINLRQCLDGWEILPQEAGASFVVDTDVNSQCWKYNLRIWQQV